MKTIIALLAATVLGGVGWWIGDILGGIWVALIISSVASGIGLYYGRKIAINTLGM